MEITISSRNLELSESLISTIRKKINRLGRLNGELTRAEVVFYEEQNPRIVDREICEVFMDGRGRHIRCKVSAPDAFAAIDKAITKLEHQLAKVKTRTNTRAYVKV
ncbi:MAG: ribosome-associated translation inhibitor RaiA [Actinobacteria bacterium]|nr:ribosome-associated translation inhibitor RaiA [Actinomycetota bacterium]